ncbi:condensin complex subunit 1-like, partial [Mustelus asterias]
QEDAGPESPQPPASEAVDENSEKETPEPSELAKQEVLVQYLKDALTFASKMEGAIEIVSKFLSSKNPSVVQEAIQFFVTISEFGISQALVGMREMLPLVWSKEAGVKEAVTEAYRRLYLNRESSKPQTMVQNLTALIFDSNMDTIKCLEQLVSAFVHQNEIEPAVIQLLWERLTEKVTCSPEERRAAVILLGMAARGEPEIVGSNLETLYTVGLGPRVREQADYQLARDTCLTIGKLSQGRKKLFAGGPVAFRLPADHQLFTHISDSLTE